MVRAGMRLMRDHATRVRAGLLVLAGPNLVTGAWALFAPRSWYEDFPGSGLGWIAAFGDYNEHFIQDIGSAYLAFGALLVLAGLRFQRGLAQGALLGFLVFSVPHLTIHIFAREELSFRGYVGTLGLLGTAVALAAWLLYATRRLTETRSL